MEAVEVDVVDVVARVVSVVDVSVVDVSVVDAVTVVVRQCPMSAPIRTTRGHTRTCTLAHTQVHTCAHRSTGGTRAHDVDTASSHTDTRSAGFNEKPSTKGAARAQSRRGAQHNQANTPTCFGLRH